MFREEMKSFLFGTWRESRLYLMANARCFTNRNNHPIVHLISQYCTIGGNVFLTHLLSSFYPGACRLMTGATLVYCNCRCYSRSCECLITLSITASHSIGCLELCRLQMHFTLRCYSQKHLGMPNILFCLIL